VVASALAAELRLAASWQGLDDVVVAPVGDLAAALAYALASALAATGEAGGASLD
jgi:uncharacterized protein YcaQ